MTDAPRADSRDERPVGAKANDAGDVVAIEPVAAMKRDWEDIGSRLPSRQVLYWRIDDITGHRYRTALMPRVKVPQYIAIRSDPLPRNPNVKVLKKPLRKTDFGPPARP